MALWGHCSALATALIIYSHSIKLLFASVSNCFHRSFVSVSILIGNIIYLNMYLFKNLNKRFNVFQPFCVLFIFSNWSNLTNKFLYYFVNLVCIKFHRTITHYNRDG